MNIQAGRSIRGLLAPISWSVQDVRYAFIAPIENSRMMVASYLQQKTVSFETLNTGKFPIS